MKIKFLKTSIPSLAFLSKALKMTLKIESHG